MTALICRDERRREQVRQQQHLNGLDYLEVGAIDQLTPSLANQRVLRVYFLGKAPVALDKSNVRIEGGSRIRDIRVDKVQMFPYEGAELDDYMEVIINQPGDYSAYTLRVVEQDEQKDWRPHSAFDPRYDRIEFSFKIDCPSELDCKPEGACPKETNDEPNINYLAKDYASFRQLLFDRLALLLPDWKERHVPDIGIALVEVLAYAGDHLSYYQDAVATEAYLDTARQRISVRRHARLVDYTLHEGCNARTWMCVTTTGELRRDPKEIYFITGFDAALQALGNVIPEDALRQIPASAFDVFEPMGQQVIQLFPDHGKILFYTWEDQQCCLPRGATHATLVGELTPEAPLDEPPCEPGKDSGVDPVPNADSISIATSVPTAGVNNPVRRLHLKPGDVLIFEEVIGPDTGLPADADPKHRHAVWLTNVVGGVDPLNGQAVVEIDWASADALPFPLCLSSLGPPPECKILDNVSVACGNIILVDHGRTQGQDLDGVPIRATVDCCKAEGVLADQALIPGVYRPQLQYSPLTFSQPLAADSPAAITLMQDVRQALPQIVLTGHSDKGGSSQWLPQLELLGSGPDDQHFVAELNHDERAQLRFGDDEAGERPDAGMTFKASYRIGNGPAGNVGAGAISHLVVRNGQISGADVTVRNPLPAQGGTAAEPIAEVKLFAPNSFRAELQRAITADDYAAIVQRDFKGQVQRAVAQLSWNGSWYEVLVAVDPYGREEAGANLIDAIFARLHRYRRIGHDLRVQSARRVSLEIELLVCVLPHYLRGHVKAALLDLLGNRACADGRKGFFHPDNLTFGEGIYSSKLVALAQGVDGVESVQVSKLKRQNEAPNQEIENGVLPLAAFEIARLDNDPSFPEHGVLILDVRGGR